MPHFRRKALQIALLSLPAFALSANVLAAGVRQVKIAVNAKQCEPMALIVPAGQPQFVIQNHNEKNHGRASL